MKSINEYLINKNTKAQQDIVMKNDPVLVITHYNGAYRIHVDKITDVLQRGYHIKLYRNFNKEAIKCEKNIKNVYYDEIQPDYISYDKKHGNINAYIFLKEKALQFIERSELTGYYIYDKKELEDTVSNKSFKRSIEDIKKALNQ